jgi:hypothetical protein
MSTPTTAPASSTSSSSTPAASPDSKTTPAPATSAPASPAGQTDFGNGDTSFANPDRVAYARTPTVKDDQGLERVLGGQVGGWKPAPMEASDEEKAAAEKRVAFEEASQKERLSLLGRSLDNGDRLPNNAADGGSQTATA